LIGVNFRFLSLSLATFYVCLAVPSYADQLKRGKYFGGIQMEGSSTQISTVLDVFAVTAPETPNFPQVDAILRVSPGGFSSAEYVSFRFQNFSYNFQKGIVYLDDPSMDVTATLEATKNDTVIVLEGPIVFRPSLKKGRMRVQMDEDEPSPSGQVGFRVPFLPSLGGQYLGKCEKRAAALQIETGRETAISRAASTGLEHYVVTGRIGYKGDSMCSETGTPRPAFCAQRFFTNADYRFFDEALLLQGPRAALNCTTSGTSLACRQQIRGKNETCLFEKTNDKTTPPAVYPRRFFMKVNSDQKKPLPRPEPPLSAALVSALNGTFYGFLHHENRDQYQLVRMNISASSTTIHPHINERVFITASLSTHFGSSWNSRSLFGQTFSRKEFYVVPYYRLESDESDTFLVVDEWKTGFIRATWYSKEYGRVGTVEFIKGTVPSVPENIAVTPSIDGDFQGPIDRGPETNDLWWLRTLIPGQIPKEKRNTAVVQGEYEFKSGIMVGRAFESGAIDMYTGAVSFLVPDPGNYVRLISGVVPKPGIFQLVWPGACIFSVSMGDYFPYTYRKLDPAKKGE
jgi:hypothetical protein